MPGTKTYLEAGENLSQAGMLCTCGVPETSLEGRQSAASTLYPKPRPMGPRKGPGKTSCNSGIQVVRRFAFGEDPSGFREEGRGKRMRWGYESPREEMRRVYSGGSPGHEEGYGFHSDIKIERQDLVRCVGVSRTRSA